MAANGALVAVFIGRRGDVVVGGVGSIAGGAAVVTGGATDWEEDVSLPLEHPNRAELMSSVRASGVILRFFPSRVTFIPLQ